MRKKCGVKFCGGCNPRYERGAAYRQIKECLDQSIDFDYAEEENVYDILLVIGGCSACCASYKQYQVEGHVFKIWDEEHIPKLIEELKSKVI